MCRFLTFTLILAIICWDLELIALICYGKENRIAHICYGIHRDVHCDMNKDGFMEVDQLTSCVLYQVLINNFVQQPGRTKLTSQFSSPSQLQVDYFLLSKRWFTT